MKDITQNFGTLFYPISAMVVYQSKEKDNATYIEHFDMDKNGNPVNAHPLTVREAKTLVRALNTDTTENKTLLNCKGILPTNILRVDQRENGSVVWFTKTRKVKMHFVDKLEIPSGIAEIPALLWYASKNILRVFALTSNRRPNEKTLLFHAPFFNMYKDSHVCMGTVNVNIKKTISVEEFIQIWEDSFFNSYFSHLINEHNPIDGNCVSLWKELVGTNKAFPKVVLKNTGQTLKDLLS